MKKLIWPGIVSMIVVGMVFFVQRNKQQEDSAMYTVGVLQTASHPALDAVLDGFKNELENLMGNTKISFVIQNAQGSVSSAHTIAQQFHGSSKYDLFFTIATPAAQSMHAVEKERPIIIAAVTDPNVLGFVYPESNVYGVTDMIDVPAEVAMLHTLVPNAKNIGLLYTVGETNSLVLVDIMKQELIKLGLTPVDFAVSGESDIQAMVELACRKSDLILAPTDNVVASTISLITMITKKYKKPLIVSDNMLVSSGALAAQGVDYEKSGRQAARHACDLLTQDENISQLGIEQTKSEQIFINQKTLKLLELTVPQEIADHVVLIS